MKINQEKRNSVSIEFRECLSDKDYDDCFCDAIMWSNGEGFDISIETSTGQHKNFALSIDEVHAIAAAVNLLELKHD